MEACFNKIEDFIDDQFEKAANYKERVVCIRNIKEKFVKDAKADPSRHGVIGIMNENMAITKDSKELRKIWDRGLSFMKLEKEERPWHVEFE